MKETSEFEEVVAALIKTHSGLPDKVAATAIAFTKQRFREQNWIDTYTETWKQRKEQRGARRRNRSRRALLVKTGTLKRSIRKYRADAELVEIGTDVAYARAHNEGVREVVSVRAHSRHRYKKVKETITTRSGRERNRTTKQVAEGADIQVKAHRRRMRLPRRQFIGQSYYLGLQLERMITAEYMKTLKQ